MNRDRLLYPVLGVGGFFAMFWLGVVVAYDLGIEGGWSALVGAAGGVAAASLVAEMEHRDTAARDRGRRP